MISVIIPIYNAANCIDRCLDSLIKQTIFDDLEIILVNDGSTDNTSVILQKIAAGFENIKIINVENGGVSRARNIGLSNANGDFISFVDADDYLDLDFYELLLKEITKGYDIVCCGFFAEYENGTTIIRAAQEIEVLINDKAMYSYLLGHKVDPNVWNKLFRKELLKDTYFDSKYKIAEDKYFIFQLLKKECRVLVLPIAKYHYYISDESVTRDAFSEKKFHALQVVTSIANEVKDVYPQFSELANSAKIDVECRICGEMCYFGVVRQYESLYRELRKDIGNYSILKKAKYSSKKHLLAFIAAKISPALYAFIKKNLRFEFK
ncbi:MAG: glycosyltransferase family 2 protein [Anaerobutyricum hallii]|uniref:glycosyltransferase family 2 protein n=1 Tax=Anaerobutyricum hallii TaxID=39488 RepID=UPI002A83E779|nr:glycosyltransferase family 2 protein [Anaerobutyricum hallii]MDY4576876.1 glycosyltransferase family 2 protein [Anaerobutyricum hallii]